MARVLFSYGLQTQYDLVSPKSEDTIYFITDTQRIYKGGTLIANALVPNVVFADSVPEAGTAQDDVLYIVTEGGTTTMYVKNGEQMEEAGGGTASDIADGIVSIDKLADGLVATDLTSPSATTIPTTQAVADAIATAKEEAIAEAVEQAVAAIDLAPYDAAFTGVSAEPAPDGETGTVLKFTTKGGSTQQVTIADIFLSAASYDSASHDLTLTLNDEEQSTVVVNLDELVGNSLSDITVGDDETFTVELGTGGTLGGYKTGDQIAADTSIETIIKKLLMKQVPPTYSQPSVSIANNGGSASGSYEFGTTVSPKLRATFNKADAGELTNIQINKAGSIVGEAGTTSPHDVTDTPFQLTATTSYQAVATYAEGAIKDDNLGEPYPEGHIAAGSKTSSNFTYTPYRNVFYGGTTDKPALDSAYVRARTARNAAYAKNAVLNFQVPSGTQRVIVAFDATASSAKPKFETTTGLTMDVSSSFTSQTVAVEGAEGAAATNYTVWVYEPASPYGVATDFRVTLN